MSFGVIYNVWDGCELLEPSIRSIRNAVDEVVVVYQEKSYYGNYIKEYDINLVLSDLKHEHLIDDKILVNFDNDCKNSHEAKQMEKLKYQIGLDYLEKKHIDYFMMRAVDEFFIEDELRRSLGQVQAKDYHRTFCEISTYSSPTLKDVENTDHVNGSFIYKMIEGKKIGQGMQPPLYIDAVANYGNNTSDYIFPNEEVVMHHYRLSRLDLKRKALNSSISNKRFLLDQAKNISNFMDKAETVKNLFNIDLDKFVERYCE